MTRSFDERSHSYLGYILSIRGTQGDQENEFLVAVGEAAHEQHSFRVGTAVSGRSHPVADRRTELADLYKTSAIGIEYVPRP